MITPQDIQNVKFERSASGYDMRQVDDFLDLLAADFTAIIEENEELRRKLKILEIQQGGAISMGLKTSRSYLAINKNK